MFCCVSDACFSLYIIQQEWMPLLSMINDEKLGFIFNEEDKNDQFNIA